MAVTLSLFAGAGAQFFDNNGVMLSGGLVYTYGAGTTTPLAAYTSNTGATALSNPIVLDASGRVPTGEIWLTYGQGYKFTVKTSTGTLIGTYDNIPSAALPPLVNDAASIAYEQGASITAGNFIIGQTYLITFIGSTNFQSIGAVSNTVGTYFIATGVGSGTGTAELTRTVQAKLQESVSVKDFGAVGDFNPSTGVGTNDRAAIQAAFTYAMTVSGGCKVIFPSGNYYGGSATGAYTGGVQILLGSTTPASANNISIEGQGATLYQGAAGRFIGIFGANNVSISGLTIYGYTGGTLGSTRENDALITVNYNSQNVSIYNNYLTNSLGDCIYLGGSLISGGELGYQCLNINIYNNVLKQRYGNGVTSFTGGTYSRACIAIIDAVNVAISNNIAYGIFALEPNLDLQHSVGIAIQNNAFKSGNVTAQSTIGTAYWFDEPINLSGGSVIPQVIYFAGKPGTPVVSNNTAINNTFEYGSISQYNVYKFASISNNVFVAGLIISGNTSGANNTNVVSITNNIAYSPLTSETTFIKLSGYHTFGNFSNNRAVTGFTYCINNDGASTGDFGRCVFANNSIDTGTAVLGLTIQGTSTESGSVNNATNYTPSKSSYIQTQAFYSPLTTIVGATGAQALDWLTYRSNNWYITIPAATAGSISNITNSPGDGAILTIISGASGGGGTLTFTFGNFRTKGSVDAVLTGNQVITFISRTNLWFEVSRSF